MLARINRFHGRRSLQFAYKHGIMARGQLLSTKAILNTRQKNFRCAVVVSKKVSKSAVVRNRIRRRLYAIVRQLKNHIDAPYDIIVIVNDEQVATIPPQKLVSILREQLTKAGVFNVNKRGNGHAIINAQEN